MSATERDRLRIEAATLKMRALRLRAGGNADDRWDAICMLRDAACKELAAIARDGEPAPIDEALARVEACSLFLLAKDPLRALGQWARISREPLPAGAAAATLALKPLFGAALAELARAWREVLGESVPGAPAALRADQLRALVGTFPGVAELWWGLSQCTKSAGEAEMARGRAARLLPSTADAAAAQAAWDGVAPALLCRARLELSVERRGGPLSLSAASHITAAFADLLSTFAEQTAAIEIEIASAGAVASQGALTVEIVAGGLHPFALEELDRDIGAKGRTLAVPALRLVSLLGAHRVKLTATVVSPAQPGGLVIDEARIKPLLVALQAARRRSLDSRDIPQADDIERVFRMVERIVRGGGGSPELTPRQLSYYRRAAKLLGLLTEADEPTPAGRLIARLDPEARLRVGVVHFESSACGDAWIAWKGGRTLLDVDPATAAEFLRESAPGLARDTAERRAQTLAAWHRALIGHHYSKGLAGG